MKLGFVSDSLGGLSFDAMLGHAQRLGVNGVEVNTCGWSRAPHFDLKAMLGNAAAQKTIHKAFQDRGLEIISLNANGNPLHPTDPAQGEGLKNTIRVAGEMGIKTVCTMSGLPAEWWRQFCYRLKMAGYDGGLSIEREDVLLNSVEGLEKSVALLKGVMPTAAADFKLQDI